MATAIEKAEVIDDASQDQALPPGAAVPEHVVEIRLSARDFDIVVNAINSDEPNTILIEDHKKYLKQCS